jgi:hypothetical protein
VEDAFDSVKNKNNKYVSIEIVMSVSNEHGRLRNGKLDVQNKYEMTTGGNDNVSSRSLTIQR